MAMRLRARAGRIIRRDLPWGFLHRPGRTEPRVRRTVDLPFEPTVPDGDIATLVAACAIDHTVPPGAMRG